ncbi:MAG: response regulator [Geothrix sp.]|nr:response regulator [Geothrix sp.]
MAITAVVVMGFVALKAGPRRVVKVATFPHAPAAFMGEDGKAKGFYVDMLQEIAARENWELRFVPGTWQQGLDRARTGAVDLLTSVAHTPERDAFLDYGAEPSFTVWSVLYAHPQAGIRTVLDAKDRRIGLMRGDVNGEHFRDLCARFNIPATYVVLDGFEEVLRAVESGQVEAGVVSNVFGHSQESRFRVERTPVVFSPFDIYFAVARGRDPDLLATLDTYLREGKRNPDSSYHRALHRWLSPQPKSGLPAWALRVGLGILAALALAILVALAFRRRVDLATAEIRNLNAGLERELADRRRMEAQILLAEQDCRDNAGARQVLERQMQHAQKLESLGVLAGGIAHDFNNLLTAMLGHMNVAQMKLAPESPALPHLDSLERIIHRAADLTRQMLAYSGKGRFVVRSYDLNHVVQEVTHLLEVSISKKIALRFDLAPALPLVEADAAQIQQVIMNLVTNAADAIGDRDGTIRLTTGSLHLDRSYLDQVFQGQELPPGTYVSLEVSDTGCGMASEVMGRIFEPFFTTKVAGRGLGLSATMGILKGHRAGMRIYSEPGRGTTFKLLFPTSEVKREEEAAQTAAPALARKATVLLVDDEEMIREAAAAVLESLGLTVITASDGLEALEAVQRTDIQVDVVLMDLTMPRMDGREAFQAIRRIHPGLPVILSSGYNEQESIQDFMGRGLAAFLQKPYTLRALERTVLEVLAGRA